jgi:hypothetical protein
VLALTVLFACSGEQNAADTVIAPALRLLASDDLQRLHILCSGDQSGVCELAAFGLFPVRVRWQFSACPCCTTLPWHGLSPGCPSSRRCVGVLPF